MGTWGGVLLLYNVLHLPNCGQRPALNLHDPCLSIFCISGFHLKLVRWADIFLAFEALSLAARIDHELPMMRE